MIMFPAHLSSSRCVNGGFSEGGYECFISLGRGLFADLMAEDDHQSRTEEDGSGVMKDVDNNNIIIHGTEDDDEDDDHGRWLQLSLGGGHMQSATSHHHHRSPETPSVDLHLLPGGGGGGGWSQRIHQPPLTPPPPQLFFRGHTPAAAMNSVQFITLQQQQQQQQQQRQQQQQETTNYNYLQLIRPFPANYMTTSSLSYPPVSSTSSFSGGSSEHQGRPMSVHRRLNVARVINPPRRLNSGVWFMLQASQNQSKEPFLPQIPKSYMRIKDGRMTVGLLIKYLVNKLELASESEIEITCKGRQLLSLSTLLHVRDTIWNSPRNDIGFTVVPRSSATSSHLMVLNYGRIA